MATFGTPFPGASDAGNALRCAQAMLGSIDDLNRERKHRGEPPIRISLGLHYGEVVLGDIGLNRLEFAVIGTTVNAASRLESLTREFGCAMIPATTSCSGHVRKPRDRTPTSRISSHIRRRRSAVLSNRSESGHVSTTWRDR